MAYTKLTEEEKIKRRAARALARQEADFARLRADPKTAWLADYWEQSASGRYLKRMAAGDFKMVVAGGAK